MHYSANIVSELEQLATAEELELIGLLLSDSCVSTSIRELNREMLSKIFNVSILSYENQLKERHGVVFRNYPGTFEIVKDKISILKADDDVLGTCGLALVQRAMARDNTSLMSEYLAGRRSRESLHELAAVVDRDGVRLAAGQIRDGFPDAAQAVKRLIPHCEKVANIPLPDECSTEQQTIWCEYLSSVATLYTQLRTSPVPIVVVDRRIKATVMTIGAYVKCREKPESFAISAKDNTFSETELAMIDMLELEGEVVEQLEGQQSRQYWVNTQRDAFEYVGSHFIAPPALPDWEAIPHDTAVSSTTHITAVASPSTARVDREPEAILKDYYGVDHNKFRDVVQQLSKGGLSRAAQELWAGLSKAKQTSLLRPIQGPISFREGVTLVANQFGLADDEALAEVVASKLVLARSAFHVRKADMTVSRV